MQEKLQKEAFETLMLQKDAKTQRITSQIELIEQELAQLTLLEVEQRDMRLDTQMVQNYGLFTSAVAFTVMIIAYSHTRRRIQVWIPIQRNSLWIFLATVVP